MISSEVVRCRLIMPDLLGCWAILRDLARSRNIAGLKHVLVSIISAQDRKSTRLNSSHSGESRMPSSA